MIDFHSTTTFTFGFKDNFDQVDVCNRFIEIITLLKCDIILVQIVKLFFRFDTFSDDTDRKFTRQIQYTIQNPMILGLRLRGQRNCDQF